MKWNSRRWRNRHVLLADAARGSELSPVELFSVAARNGIKQQDAIDTLARFEGEFFEYHDGKWRLSMASMKEIETIDEFLEEARKLRAASEEAEARFLLFLRAFETERADLWKATGCASFDGFLQSSQLINSARYRNFCSGAELAGSSDAVLRIGAQATMELGAFKAPTDEGVRKFVDTASKFREVHGGTASEQTATDWRKRFDGAVPKVVRQASRLSQLESENQQLRAENRELQRKLKNAEKTIAKLQKQPASAAA